MGKNSVFVTVGSTSFDDLIESVCSQQVLTVLKDLGYEKIVFQIGKGCFAPMAIQLKENYGFDTEVYKFKDSLKDDMTSAHLVISHAGAGSIMEALKLGKKLIVVVNEKLMNNHQSELAEELARQQLLIATTTVRLPDALLTSSSFQMTAFPHADVQNFGNYIDKVMGLPARP